MLLNTLVWQLLVPATLAFNCDSSSFQSVIPSNASVAFAYSQPDNSTFEVPSDDIPYRTSPSGLRALCAVQIRVPSTPTSEYSFGLFLPDDWNSRFLAVGNGGFAGGVNWLDMGAGVGYGFAVMSTDTGHNSSIGDITWALNEPEKRNDFGYRAMHGSTVLAKEIIEAYYKTKPEYNYYSGCSTGGRQGLKEVEMFPEDFDGVLAGAPAWWTTHLQTWTVKLALYNLPVDSDHHIPNELFEVIGKEVLKQCDHQDGLADGIISDPEGCDFFPEALLCGSDGGDKCLSGAQIGTLYKIYNDYVETDQTFVFPHLALGSEAQWPVLLGEGKPSSLGTQYVQNFLLNDQSWDYNTFNYSIVQLADKLRPGHPTADNFDISPFKQRGGKLLHYHGYADALISTGSSTYFYKQVLTTLKQKRIELDDFYRFFLVPGMQHCTGTPENVNAPWYIAGGNQAGAVGDGHSISGVPGFEDADHDALLALMKWTEEGTAPEQIIATKWEDDSTMEKVSRQRPLCPFPKQARYKGDGDQDDAGSWYCAGIYDDAVKMPC